MEKVTPINEEYLFDGNVIISQTDLNGNIIFANRKFCEVSGYKVEELVGQSHNLIRHPDMPKAVFEKLWTAIESGQAWNGLIKNLRKDGLYYWVDTEILPTRDEHNEITGYIAARKQASRKDITENDELFKKMLEAQK